MADIKTLFKLKAYTPADVPRDAQYLQRFLSDELKKIEFPLQQLTNDWRPNFAVVMTGATTPNSWTTPPTDLTNWASFIASKEVYKTGIIIDLVTGEITMGGAVTDEFLVKISGNVVVERLNGDNNTSALLHIDVSGTDHILDAAYASNSTPHISLSGATIINIFGGDVISLQTEYINLADVSYLTSSFTIEVLGVVTN